MIVWLMGLSGAGKTTIGRQVHSLMKASRPNTVFLDGDILRNVWGDSLGHDIAGRRKNAERISRLCAMLDRQGIDAVVAILSIFPEWQAWNRENISQYIEVFLDAPLDLVEKRDAKGIYGAARRGELTNVVGVDIPMPRPAQADLTIGVPGLLRSPADIAADIVRFCEALDRKEDAGAAAIYPYSMPGRERKGSYFYAPSRDPDFMLAWKRRRKEDRTRFIERSLQTAVTDRSALPQSKEYIALSGMLRRIEATLRDHYALIPEDLDQMVMKFEVFGRLFDRYLPSLRRHEAAKPASVGDYLYFARLLVLVSRRDGGAKYLSTLLKLLDYLTSLEADAYDPLEAAQLLSLLTQEQHLVWQTYRGLLEKT